MNHVSLIGFAVLCTCLIALAGEDASCAVGLQQAAGAKFLVGTAVSTAGLSDPLLAKLITHQFGCVTAENAMKPEALQPENGKFTFENADRIVRFAEANHLKVIGHTLCWHQQSPRWMFQDELGHPLPREKALENLRDHIRTVTAHFAGHLKGWDVVNEAVSDGPESMLRDTPARRAIGDDFVLKAFQFAHEADPNVELYYNDYNIEMDYKRDRAVQLIRSLKAADLRIDGVGIQGHWLLDSPGISEIERGIRAFRDLGVNVMITELDVDPLPRGNFGAGADLNATQRSGLDPYKHELPDAVQQKLAHRYAEIFSMLLKYPNVKRVTFWGASDGSSWLNDFPVRGRTNYPLLWDRQLRPKPAFHAVIASLSDRPLRLPF